MKMYTDNSTAQSRLFYKLKLDRTRGNNVAGAEIGHVAVDLLDSGAARVRLAKDFTQEV